MQSMAILRKYMSRPNHWYSK